jgi:FAD/FMN-containing dehydrogenase
MSREVSRRDALKKAAALGLSAHALSSKAATTVTPPGGPAVLNDASGLDATPVKRNWRPPADDAGFIDGLRRELNEATRDGRPVIVGGARHSMGGQSLPREGTAITLDTGWRRPDLARGVYQARAGARWRDVIQTLRPVGFSPKVMQSNSDFTLGGAFSVNAHGWAAPMGPVGSTVRSLRLMLASGEVVTCSRTQEPELFSLAMGGYGLLGVLLDFEMEMVPDVVLEPRFERLAARDFGPRFQKTLLSPSVVMGYGRLSVARGDFLKEALMVTFRPAPGAPKPRRAQPSGDGLLSSLTRDVYRAQIGSEYWKEVRWYAETVLDPQLEPRQVSRNDLLSSPVSALADHDHRRTDILHEYFLPPEHLGDFLQACREVIPKSAQLLNITLRYVAADALSTLAFAPAPRVAAVMSFCMPRTAQADLESRPMTQALIDHAIRLGGSFYLPYRLHARRDQLDSAYPRLDAFLEAKRRHDPRTLFRNALWDHYFA